MAGKGAMSWPDGRNYTGFYKDSHKHGWGRCTLEDGAVIEGEWIKGRPEGKTKYTSPDGEVQEVIWENGEVVSGDCQAFE